MGYEVLARKWRPQQFGDVVGQEHVTRTLQNAIQSDRIAHAYLFVGPRGTGKTSIARIFAKALNCTEGPTLTPCDTCDSCREVMAGNSLDVMEIDGASNNGVEQVRDLRETVKYAPTRSTYKIYIIDEVHMLSTAAFNALLKTLEEPPPHVKFFFATTEPEKILATIVSRCQRFDLRRIPTQEIMERLRLIAKDEGIEVEDDALLAVARGAEGGLRDAESALDQLISFKGAKIDEADVLSVFGLVARTTLEELAGAIIGGDLPGIIERVHSLDEAGKDLQRLVIELIEYFRNLLVFLSVEDGAGVLDVTPAQADALRGLAGATSTGRVLRVTEVLSDTADRMRFTLSRRTLLETALIRSARAATVVTLDELMREVRALQKGEGSPPVSAPVEAVAPKKVRRPAEAQATVGTRDDEATAPAAPARVREDTVAADDAPDVGLALLVESWGALMDRVGRMAVGTRALLADALPVAVSDTTVRVGVDPEFADEIDRLKAPRPHRAIEKAMSDCLGRKVSVAFEVLKDGSTAVAAVTARNVKAESAKAKGASSGGKATTGDADGGAQKDWLKEPAVRAALDTFRGTVREVRE